MDSSDVLHRHRKNHPARRRGRITIIEYTQDQPECLTETKVVPFVASSSDSVPEEIHQSVQALIPSNTELAGLDLVSAGATFSLAAGIKSPIDRRMESEDLESGKESLNNATDRAFYEKSAGQNRHLEPLLPMTSDAQPILTQQDLEVQKQVQLPDLLLPLPPTVHAEARQDRSISETIDPHKMDHPATAYQNAQSSVSDERLQTVRDHWHPKSRSSKRLAPCLWQYLAMTEQVDVIGRNLVHSWKSDTSCSSVTSRLFDDDSREQIQLTFDSLVQTRASWSSNLAPPVSPDSSSCSPSSVKDHCSEIVLPSTRSCKAALEIYFNQFHPTLPLFHLPTFSAKDAPFPLSFVLCLIGFSILGTPSALGLISASFEVSGDSPRSLVVKMDADESATQDRS